MKRFMSIALAVVMAFALQATAFAAAPANMDGPGGIILPRAAIYPSGPISGTGSVRTTSFTATPSNGNYIRVWYENNATSKVMVYLYRTDSGKLTVAARFSVEGNGGQGHDVYYTSTAGSGTYYVQIEAVGDGGAINGNLSVTQTASIEAVSTKTRKALSPAFVLRKNEPIKQHRRNRLFCRNERRSL